MKDRYRLLPFSMLFGIVILIFLRDFIFLGGTWKEGDYGVQHYPWAKFYAEQLGQFRLPLWCDFNHCGFPLLAEGQVGAIYPINLLLFFMLPFEFAYNIGIIFHFFIAAVCMFVYLRFLKCCFVSGFIGAFLWVFGSAFAGAEYNLMALRVLAWFPLGLFFIGCYFEERKSLFLLLLAVLYFFQWTAGSVQFACYAIFFSSLYFSILLITTHLHEGAAKLFFKSLFLYALSIGLSLGLSAAQILPTLELTRETLRLGYTNLEFSLSGSFSPLALFSMILPRSTSSISGWKIYLGVFPLFLLIFLYFKTKKEADAGTKTGRFYLRLFLGFALLSLFLALGKFNPLYRPMISFLQLYFFRAPAKFTVFTCFFLSVLSAYGMELFLKALKGGDIVIGSARKAFARLYVASLIVFSVSVVLIHAFPEFWMGIGRAYVRQYIYQKGFHSLSLEGYYQKVVTHYDALRDAFSLNIYNIFSIGLILFALLILFRGVGRLRASAVKYLVVVSIILDLFVFHFYGTGFRGNIAHFEKKGDLEWLEFIRNDREPFRVYLYARDAESLEKLGISPNANILHHMDYVGAYSPLITRSYTEYFRGLGNMDDALGFIFTKEELFSKNIFRLNLANVKYIYSTEKIAHADLSMVGRTQSGNYLYVNQGVLPRAFFIEKVQFLPEQKSLNFNPSGQYPSLGIIKHNHWRRRIISKENSDGWLFLSSLWYPGWHAYVDGKETEIYRANDLFQAIPLKQGERTIDFLYQPESFKTGATISLLALCAIVLLSLLCIFPPNRSS